jgi:hypothetical protein
LIRERDEEIHQTKKKAEQRAEDAEISLAKEANCVVDAELKRDNEANRANEEASERIKKSLLSDMNKIKHALLFILPIITIILYIMINTIMKIRIIVIIIILFSALSVFCRSFSRVDVSCIGVSECALYVYIHTYINKNCYVVLCLNVFSQKNKFFWIFYKKMHRTGTQTSQKT